MYSLYDVTDTLKNPKFGELYGIIRKEYLNDRCSPNFMDVFKCFKVVPLDDFKVVFVCEDTYFIKLPSAIGIGSCDNKSNNRLLEYIQDCFHNHNSNKAHTYFDRSLETLSNQGVLFLNIALTCNHEKGILSHKLLWRPFMKELFLEFNKKYSGIVYIFVGDRAKYFRQFINKTNNHFINVDEKYIKTRNIKDDINKFLINYNQKL